MASAIFEGFVSVLHKNSNTIFRGLQLLVIVVTLLTMGAVYWTSQRLANEATTHWRTNAERVASKTTEFFVYWLEFRRQKTVSIATALAAYPVKNQAEFTAVVDRFTQDADGQTQLQLALLQRRQGIWQHHFDYGITTVSELSRPEFASALVSAIRQASTLDVTSLSAPIIDADGHAQIAVVHPIHQDGEVSMLVAVFDISELLINLQKLHVPTGVTYGLMLKPNNSTQTWSPLYSPPSIAAAYDYQTTEEWGGGVWNFKWYVQSDFMGGADLSLARGLRWGGMGALFLLGVLVLALLEYALRLLSVMKLRQQAQRALADSEQRLMTIANQLPGVVYRSSATAERILLYVSEPVQALTGVNAGRLLNEKQPLSSLIHPEDRERVETAIAYAIKRGDSFDLEYRLCHVSGRESWVLDHGQVSIKEGEQDASVDGIWLDVSDRRAAQDALARALGELRNSNDTLEQRVLARTQQLQLAMDQLVQSEKLASLGSLVAGMAHELNTPVGNTMTVATAMKSRLDEFNQALDSGGLRKSVLESFVADAREAMFLIESNTRRAADLVSNFKQVAVDQTSMRTRQFDLMEIVEETLTTLKPLFKHKSHQIVTDIQSGVMLNSYPGALEQVIVNLVQNALVHGLNDEKPGRIDLRGGLSLNYAWVEVADNGKGIAPDILPNIFDPFFTTRLGQGGSGLGLYITYNLVSGLLGGELTVDSKVGFGSCFRVQIPLEAPQSKERLEEHKA